MGKGAVFSLLFLLRREGEGDIIISLYEMETEKHIIFVDDEPDIAQVVLFRLKHEGYQVTIAQNGREALMWALRKPHLILLDVVLPDIDGFEVCKRIKMMKGLKDIPIIFFTAEVVNLSVLEKKVKESGAQGYIVKPFSSEELLEKIREYI